MRALPKWIRYADVDSEVSKKLPSSLVPGGVGP